MFRLKTMPRKGWLLVVVLVQSSHLPAYSAGELFRCVPTESVRWNDDNGMLDASSWIEGLQLLIDTSSGIVRIGTDDSGGFLTMEWEVVQEGSSSNDFVATPRLYGDRKSDARTAATHWLRVRSWGEKVTFIWWDFSELISGTCEPVR